MTGPTIPTNTPHHRLQDRDDRVEVAEVAAVVTTDRHTFVQLLRRNAVVFQVVFALLWSLRFMAVVGIPEVPLAVMVGGAFVVRAVFRATRGLSARSSFRTPQGKQFLRPVTVLTLVQIAASVVLPVIAGALGADEWALPMVAATIGLFLIGFARSLDERSVGYIGIGSTIVALALPLLAGGDALVALTAANMMAALVVSAVCCARVAARDQR